MIELNFEARVGFLESVGGFSCENCIEGLET
jgi:hypothetical protein